MLKALDKPVSFDFDGQTFEWGGVGHWPLFAGMNIIEDEGLLLEVATELQKMCKERSIPWILKCSYDKANRQSIKSYRGPGVTEGLKILARIKSKLNCPLITDIHTEEQAPIAAEIADVIQVPAFLCRQTDLLVAAAKTNKVLNIKKAQFLAPWDMKAIVNKAHEAGNEKILLCERGTILGYNRLVVDMISLAEMRKLGIPVVMDASHSVQLPGGKGTSSDGRREMIPLIARASMAAGVDGMFFECHPDPENSLCDGPNVLPLDIVPEVLDQLCAISKALS